MKTRKELYDTIKSNKDQIEALEQENKILAIEVYKLNDDITQYKEELSDAGWCLDAIIIDSHPVFTPILTN